MSTRECFLSDTDSVSEIRNLDIERRRLFLVIDDYDALISKWGDVLAILDPGNALERRIELNALRRVVPLKDVIDVKAERVLAVDYDNWKCSEPKDFALPDEPSEEPDDPGVDADPEEEEVEVEQC